MSSAHLGVSARSSARAHARDPPGPQRDAGAESWIEKFFAALPLFIVGWVCLALTFELYFSGTVTQLGGGGSVHLQPWALFLALAVTGLAAGTFAMLTEEEPTDVSEAAEPPPAVPSAVPAWDESLLEAEASELPPPRTWERSAGWSEGPIAESVPPEAVLSQLDEIEASLRKKSRPPSSD